MIMGYRQDMTPEQKMEWDIENYKKRLKERIGRNYPYWNDGHDKMLNNGWELYQIVKKSTRQWSKIFKKYATSSEEHAKKIVCELREKGYRANIVCGYEKNRQRVKMYSIIFKQPINKTKDDKTRTNIRKKFQKKNDKQRF